jgi:hypothetical protein
MLSFKRLSGRLLARTGLVGDYRLEVEQDAVLEEVIATTSWMSWGTNNELTEWVVECCERKIWRRAALGRSQAALLNSLAKFFREEFKDIEDEVISDHLKPQILP